MAPNTVSSIFFDIDFTTLIAEPSLLSRIGFPIACFLCFLPEEQNHHEKRAKQRFKHCENIEQSNGLVCVFREVREIVDRIVDEYLVIIHRSDLVDLLGLITCVCI